MEAVVPIKAAAFVNNVLLTALNLILVRLRVAVPVKGIVVK